MFEFWPNFVHWIAELPLTEPLRESDWQFAAIEATHILGLAFSVGTIMWLDLRLLGLAMRDEPVADVLNRYQPRAVLGFGVMFLTGVLLFLCEPEKAYATWAFHLKLLMIMLAGLNALYFHKNVARDAAQWEKTTPWQARMVGFISLGLWFSVVTAGRFMAYR
jgi:Family of unknown function (DUF6644)